MASINVAFCEAFIDENRNVAQHLKAQAEAAIAELPSIADDDRRRRVAEFAKMLGRLAIERAQIARLQERDLGVKCHCPHLPV